MSWRDAVIENQSSVKSATRWCSLALALLVIEGVIGVVVATSHAGETTVRIAVFVIAGLFLVVVGAVTFITIRWPTHLYEEVRRDIKSSRQMNELLDGKAFRDAVKDVVSALVKPECRADDSADRRSDEH
jgi:heme A synthase